MKRYFSTSALLSLIVFTAFATAYSGTPSFASDRTQEAKITPIAELQRGTTITIRGEVVRITDEDEFILKDATGSVRVYVGSTMVPAEVGESITVSGFVDDDVVEPKEIYAKTLTRADGSVVKFDHKY